jgi:hypothetical protein
MLDSVFDDAALFVSVWRGRLLLSAEKGRARVKSAPHQVASSPAVLLQTRSFEHSLAAKWHEPLQRSHATQFTQPLAPRYGNQDGAMSSTSSLRNSRPGHVEALIAP